MTLETARLDLPFVGIQTFMRRSYVGNWSALAADIAFLGAPFDLGTQVRTGARLGPQALRNASMLFPPAPDGYYDHDAGRSFLPADTIRIVDIGDADIVHIDAEQGLAAIERGVRAILKAGALPLVVGGDHSIHAPCIRAFDGAAPVHVIHIDAHLDYVDQRAGVRTGQGSPLRRAAEMGHVASITHIGIRNQGSSARADFQAALAAKSTIVTTRDLRRNGIAAALDHLPSGCRFYLTIDVDAFDPSIAPGTGTPSSGGLLYYEGCDLFDALCARGTLVGLDVVELAPQYDPSGATPILIMQLLVNLLGRAFDQRRA